MMKSLALAAFAATALGAPADAAIVTATFSGVMIETAAEDGGPPWGYDAWGNPIVCDPYSATIVYNTSAGITTAFGGGESQDQTPGFATYSITVAGHTYNASSATGIAVYERDSDFALMNVSTSPGDFDGLFFEVITGVAISPRLNDPASLTAAQLTNPANGGNVIMCANGGGLYGDFDVEKLDITVSAPEPSTWAMLLVGFAGLAYAGGRSGRGGVREA